VSKTGAAKTIATLTAAFNKELPKPTLRVYLAELQDADDGLLMASALEIIRLNKFFPTIAEIRETMLKVDPATRLAPNWEKAWNEVLDTARKVGKDHRPDWSHEAIARTVQVVGGYYEVCMTTNPANMQYQFRQAYIAIQKDLLREKMLERGNDSGLHIDSADGGIDGIAGYELESGNTDE
tara:strand:+ start:1763 stop:2305 length:543 start_codon:yes stop_codon:yes gene_type:complete